VSGKVGITDLNLAVQEKDLARRQNIATLRDYWLNYYNLRRITLYDFEKGRRLGED
jgi:outer membrane protein